MALSTVLLSVLGFAGLTQVLVHRREARAAKLYPPSGQDVEVEGIRIHVQVMGEGPDLVLIHGSSGNLRDFTHSLAPRLAARYRVFAVDRPGLGWSDLHPEGDDIVAQARVIQAAVAKLGAEKPIVLGQSYGGSVALAWAVTLPDRLAALVPVSAPSYPNDTGLGTYYAITSHPLGQFLVVPLLTAFVPTGFLRRAIETVFTPQTAPAGYVDHFGPDAMARRQELRVNARQRKLICGQLAALRPGYDGIRVPVEMVHGDADPIVQSALHSEPFLADHPGANLTLLPGIGHMPHHVAQDETIAAIDRAALRAGLK